jgi:predicted anti-sigma-YlaC factor YlaD
LRRRSTHHVFVDCETSREALSARLDGEAEPALREHVDRHLAQCGECRQWHTQADQLTRRLRVRPVATGPDLAAAVLARHRPAKADDTGTRAALGVLALVIGGLGMAELLAEPGPVHQAGTTSSRLVQETATCTLALAVGLFVAAARPRYAAAMLPVMVCFTGVLTVLAALDLAAGLVTVSDVLAHLPVLVASGLLYAVYRSRRCAAPAAAFDGLPGQLPEPAP